MKIEATAAQYQGKTTRETWSRAGMVFRNLNRTISAVTSGMMMKEDGQ